eukprot:7264327-Pyramimonas_sp.AAC.1
MHANTATEAFGGAPCGATKRYAERGRRMQTPTLRPSVALLMWPRSVALGGGGAWEHRHWAL